MLSPRTIKLILAFAAVYLIWGSIYLAAKLANETLPPFLQTGFHYLIAGSVLYGYASMSKPTLPSHTDWRLALLVGVLMIVIGSGGVVWALQLVPSGLTAILLATEPLWITLFSWLWFGKREKPSKYNQVNTDG